MSYWGYGYKQPTMAELKAKAQRTVQKMRKKGYEMHPVGPISGRTIAHSWWGAAWGDNMERYADLANRISRGKRYVRAGAVIDLAISKGQINAEVLGSGNSVYHVEIDIDPLSDTAKSAILKKCANQVDSLESLLSGEFPEELAHLFTARGGLFPSPNSIAFSCSCPDSAYMCKHVAATLYGIGARLDDDPLLFFELRGIDPQDLVKRAVANRVESMLKNADKPSDRIMSDDSLHEVFGL